MSTQRALVLTLAAFAVSFAALGVGGGTAWARCGGDSGCTGDLALGVAAAAPAALLASVVTLLLRKRASSVLPSRVLLAGAVGLAAVPLAVFVIRDVVTLVVVAALSAALVYLTLMEDIAIAAARAAPEAGATAGGARDAEPESRDPASADMSRRSEELRAFEPGTVSLCLLGLRDFEQMVTIYEALSAHPGTTSVVVRRFVRGFASLDVRVARDASWKPIEDLLWSLTESRSYAVPSASPSGESHPPRALPGDQRRGDQAKNDEQLQLLRWRPRR